MIRTKIKYISTQVLFFLTGFITLAAGSTVQKLIIDASIKPKGFIIPFLYGGIVGVLLGNYIKSIRQISKDLQNKNAELIQHKEELTTTNNELEKNLVLLEETTKRAEESDRLKTEFLNNISHEIRTPLNGILGFARLLNSKDIDYEKQSAFVEVINDSSKKLLDNISDLINISQIKTGQVKLVETAFNPCKPIQEIVSRYEQLASKKGLKFIVARNIDKQITLNCDASKLELIIEKILDNALKFTNEGQITLACSIMNDIFQLKISDTGIGIDPHLLNEIFNSFSHIETDSNKFYGGLGIGLSIVKGYTDLMQGNISIDSELGKGTSIKITFPVKVKKTEFVVEKKDIQELNILVAEDNDLNYEFMNEVLLSHNFNVIRASNGIDAVELCRTKNIDLVFMDIKMPHLDGIEASRRIKQMKPNIIIIIQSAYAFNEEMAKAQEIGCEGYLTKPLSEFNIIDQIKKYFRQAHV